MVGLTEIILCALGLASTVGCGRVGYRSQPGQTDDGGTVADAAPPADATSDAGASACGAGQWLAEPSPTTSDLSAIWGSSATDIWAVGRSGVIIHRDAQGWSAVDSGTEIDFRSVWAAADDDVWAVGNVGTILHWSGAAWTPVNSGVGVLLFSVFGTGPDEVWAVGDGSTVLRWAGASWSAFSPPIEPNQSLAAVWASGPADLWVGSLGGGLLRFGDGQWSQASDVDPDFWAVAGSAADDVWASGYQTVHFDGVDTVVHPLEFLSSVPEAIWAPSGRRAWLVGEAGLAACWDGAEWTPEEIPGQERQWGVWGIDGHVWSVGTGGQIWRREL